MPYRSNGRARDPIEDSAPSPLAILKEPSSDEITLVLLDDIRLELDKLNKFMEIWHVPFVDDRSKFRKALDYFLSVCWWVTYYRFI